MFKQMYQFVEMACWNKNLISLCVLKVTNLVFYLVTLEIDYIFKIVFIRLLLENSAQQLVQRLHYPSP